MSNLPSLITYSLTQEAKLEVIKQAETRVVKKLGTMQTYFSLLKGFISIGFLWMPKNCLNGGWLFSLCSMIFSFILTYYCLLKLLEAREKVKENASFSDVAYAAMGLPGRYILDIFLSLMLYGFVIALSYFTIVNLKSVADAITGWDVDLVYLGKLAQLSNICRSPIVLCGDALLLY